MAEAAERSDPPLIRLGRRRDSPWVQVYNELIDLYQPHIGGFAGIGYWTYLRRFVNHDPENGWHGRAFPNKRQLKADGQVGAERLKELERLCIAWGLLDVEVVRQRRYVGGRLIGETRRFLYQVNDPLSEDEFRRALASGELPRRPEASNLGQAPSDGAGEGTFLPGNAPHPTEGGMFLDRNVGTFPGRNAEIEQQAGEIAQQLPAVATTVDGTPPAAVPQAGAPAVPAVVPPASPPPDREPDPDTDLGWACGRYREITGRPDLNPADLRDLARQRPLDRPYLAAKLDLLQAAIRSGGLHNPRGFLLRALERDWTPVTAPASRHRSLRPHRPVPARPTVSVPAPRGTAPGLGLPAAAVRPVVARDAGAPAQLVTALVQLGVVPPTAERLVRAHPDEVGRQLGWIDLRHAQDPAALIVRAIGEGWPEPAAARQERMAEAEREQTRAQLAAFDEARRLALSPAGQEAARRGFAHIRELLSGVAGSPPTAGRTDPSPASCSPRTTANIPPASPAREVPA